MSAVSQKYIDIRYYLSGRSRMTHLTIARVRRSGLMMWMMNILLNTPPSSVSAESWPRREEPRAALHHNKISFYNFILLYYTLYNSELAPNKNLYHNKSCQLLINAREIARFTQRRDSPCFANFICNQIMTINGELESCAALKK